MSPMLKIAALAFLLSAIACGGAPSTTGSGAASPVSAAALVAPGEAKLGDHTRCPVSGDEFVVKADSPHTEQGGKTYYFCCAECVDKFKADPAKYTGKPNA